MQTTRDSRAGSTNELPAAASTRARKHVTGLSCNTEDAVTGILHVRLAYADHPDQGLGRGRLGNRPLKRAGVGHVVRDLLVTGAAVTGDLIFHVASDALRAPLDSLGAAGLPDLTAIGSDDCDGGSRCWCRSQFATTSEREQFGTAASAPLAADD